MSFITSVFSSFGFISSLLSFIGAHWIIALILTVVIVVVLVFVFSKFNVASKSVSFMPYIILIVGLLGMLLYHFYSVSQYEAQINTLTQANATLTANVAALTVSNTALTNQINADKLNAADLQAEIAAFNTVDQNSTNQLNNIIINSEDNTNQTANVALRNTTASQAAFIKSANDNMACTLSSFTNPATGTCVNGAFKPYSP
jgi:endonuclease/exonuclease/phosphatase (EEP) superfamily protein YafD